MTVQALTEKLVDFIQSILPEDQPITVTEQTPLLELGILDSLKTAILLNYIHNDLHSSVPAASLNSENFKDVRSIVAVIEEIEPVTAEKNGGSHDA